MIGWPSVCSSSWPAIRASASLAEPGPKGMTNLIGLDGPGLRVRHGKRQKKNCGKRGGNQPLHERLPPF